QRIDRGELRGIVHREGVSEVDAAVGQCVVDLPVPRDRLAPDGVDGDLPAGALLDRLRQDRARRRLDRLLRGGRGLVDDLHGIEVCERLIDRRLVRTRLVGAVPAAAPAGAAAGRAGAGAEAQGQGRGRRECGCEPHGAAARDEGSGHRRLTSFPVTGIPRVVVERGAAGGDYWVAVPPAVRSSRSGSHSVICGTAIMRMRNRTTMGRNHSREVKMSLSVMVCPRFTSGFFAMLWTM